MRALLVGDVLASSCSLFLHCFQGAPASVTRLFSEGERESMPDQDEPESSIIPPVMTVREFARHTGWSERRLREIARKIGACRIVGNRMLLTKADVEAIFEASRPCPANDLLSTREEISGTTGVRLPVNAYEVLQAMLTKPKPSNSSRSKRPRSGTAPGKKEARADFCTGGDPF